MKPITIKFVKRSAAIMAALFLIDGLGSMAHAKNEDLENAGDILQFLIPAAGLAGTYVADDPEGRIQFWETYLSAIAISTTAKFVYGKMRPTSTSETSFPSGHTTSAFAGAGFIQQRYGWLWGSMAYALAGLTAYSRIDADAHFVDDVLAGASNGLFNAWYWTSPFKSSVMLLPLTTDSGIGVSLVVQDPRYIEEEEIASGKRRPKFGYTLKWGAAFMGENDIKAPSDFGTTFDLADFNKDDDPLTTAAGIFDWYIGRRHTLSLGFWPLESRDTGSFQQPTNFTGIVFPAGAPLQSTWRHYQGWANYAYELFPESDWMVKLGAGLTYQYTTLKIENQIDGLSGKVQDSVFLPLLHLHLGYRITDRWTIEAFGNGIYLKDDKYIDAALETGYMLGERWRGAIGVGFYGRDIETSKLLERFEYTTAYLSLTYLFF